MAKKLYFSLVLGVVLLSLLGYMFYEKYNSSTKLISPIGNVGKVASNLWQPKVVSSAQNKAPEITAKSAYFVDTDTGQVFYQKNIHERMPIASLTKIMTVIIAMEHKQLQDTYLVSEHAASMEPDHMMLIAGEKLTLEELLDGIFLVSANDAAEVLAEGTTNNRDQFLELMNQKATFLGMKDTLFINPSGLEEDDKEYYSSAFDVALMSRYAVKQFPQLVDISDKPYIYLPQTETHQDYTMYTGINLLTTYPGVVGFKTGYTPEAGLTLVTLARQNGHQVLGVLLNSESRRDDAKALLDYSFAQLGIENDFR